MNQPPSRTTPLLTSAFWPASGRIRFVVNNRHVAMPSMLGTETGKSVWIPASVNGVATIGRIPNRSALPVNTTFDTVGSMSRDVRAQFGRVAGPESGASTS